MTAAVMNYPARMVEVYGRHVDADRVWWIGYAAEKPGKEWCDQYVSNATGPYKGTAWDDGMKGWVITFGRGLLERPMNSAGTFTGTTGIEW